MLARVPNNLGDTKQNWEIGQEWVFILAAVTNTKAK